MANRPAQQSETPEPIPPVGTDTGPPPGPDSAVHGSTAETGTRRPLNGIPEIRHFFRTNTDPVYFIGPRHSISSAWTAGCGNFYYIAYYDSWDGGHPRVFTPQHKPPVEFTSGEDDQQLPAPAIPRCSSSSQRRGGPARRSRWSSSTRRPSRSARAGLRADPAAARAAPTPRLQDRHHPARQRGGRAQRAQRPGLGGLLGDARAASRPRPASATDLVVQTPYGDSGKTTFFSAREADWDGTPPRSSDSEVKIMKRINHQAVAVEAVHHPARHRRRAVHDRPDRVPGAHAVQGWLVRERAVPGGAVRRAPGQGHHAGPSARRPARPRRGTGASSRSTSWSTSTPTRSTSAS